MRSKIALVEFEWLAKTRKVVEFAGFHGRVDFDFRDSLNRSSSEIHRSPARVRD